MTTGESLPVHQLFYPHQIPDGQACASSNRLGLYRNGNRSSRCAPSMPLKGHFDVL